MLRGTLLMENTGWDAESVG